MSYIVLEEPYNEIQVRAIQNIAGDVSGIVAVNLTEIINNHLESFLDILEERLIGDVGMLTDIRYNVAGNGMNNVLHVYVEGTVEFIGED